MTYYLPSILVIYLIVQTVSSSRSPFVLISLAKVERDIYNIIQSHVNASQLKPYPRVIEYLDDFNESSFKIFQEFHTPDHTFALRISKNPITCYRMVRRYARILRPMYKELPANVKQDIFKKLGKRRTEVEMISEWPSDPDLYEAMEALLRIHHVYNVNLTEFTSGNIMGTETQVGLTGEQCFEIGEFAFQSKQFTSAILWLETARSKSHMSNDSGLMDHILNTLKLATESHDVGWKDKTNRDYFYFHERLNETVEGKRVSVRDVEFEKRREDKQYELNDCEVRVWGLCSGENYQTNEEIAQLFCWYERKRNTAWTINPLKIEQLSISPYLIQIHDILRNQTIEAIKKEIMPTLTRAPRIDPNIISIFIDSYMGFSVPSDLTRLVSRRVEMITGLSVTPPGAGENFLTKAYAPGGQDPCHLDSLNFQDDHDGNRLATIIFYLEDVEMGGYTAFTVAGVSAKPIKGSALFFYNLLRNGEPDVRTQHAGCPVVLGRKLVTLENIRANAQFLSRPCGLNKHE